MSTDGIVPLGPEGGEPIVREDRRHRILAELPQFEIIESRFGPEFEGVDAHTHHDHVDSWPPGEFASWGSPVRARHAPSLRMA